MEKTARTDAASEYVPDTTKNVHHCGDGGLHSPDDLMRGVALSGYSGGGMAVQITRLPRLDSASRPCPSEFDRHDDPYESSRQALKRSERMALRDEGAVAKEAPTCGARDWWVWFA